MDLKFLPALHSYSSDFTKYEGCLYQACYLQLLAEDPSLKRFKSLKKSVWRLKRIGDVLTIVVVAGKLMSHPRVFPPLIHARMCAFTVDGIHQFYKFCNATSL